MAISELTDKNICLQAGELEGFPQSADHADCAGQIVVISVKQRTDSAGEVPSRSKAAGRRGQVSYLAWQ